MISLILGSASPRRKEILSLFKIPFQTIVSNFDEDSHPFKGDPSQYVTELSQEKSWAIPNTDSNTFVLTADTVVYREGQVYNKAKDRADARRMLSELSGKWHTVFTGVSLRKGDCIETLVDRTEVEFDALNSEETEIYLDKVHWQDKAGAYGIQDGGALLIKEIQGCYYNVKGLPLGVLKTLFLRFDVDLWNYI
jgi:septum formation protein